MLNILEVIFFFLILIYNGEIVDRVDIENFYNNLILVGIILEFFKNIWFFVYIKVMGFLSFFFISGLDEIFGIFLVMVILIL